MSLRQKTILILISILLITLPGFYFTVNVFILKGYSSEIHQALKEEIFIVYILWNVLVFILLYFFVFNPFIKFIHNIIEGVVKLKEGQIDSLRLEKQKEFSFLVQQINSFVEILKKQQKVIEEKEKLYKIIAENIEDLIIIFNKKAQIVYANPKAREYLEIQELKTSTKNLQDFVKNLLSLSDEERTFYREIKLPYQTWIGSWIIPVGDNDFLFIGRDITLFKAQEIKLFEAATRDPLTGLYNRRYLEDVLNKIWSSAKRGQKSTLLFIDMDDLKKINDELGHLAGDQVIKGIGNVLQKNIRDEDIVARWGGDEFVAVLRCSLKEAIAITERILKLIKGTKFVFTNKPIYASVSIGIVEIDGNKTIEELIKLADTLTYEAKKDGKGKFKCLS